MTEAAVAFVVGKLANIIQKENELLGGVGEKVQRVQDELIQIQCYLRDADSKRKRDERVQNWLNELLEVAYSIEDATDTFFLKVSYNGQKDPNFWNKLEKLCNKPLNVYFLHKLGTKLDNIHNELKEISKCRVAFGISDLQEVNGEADTIPPRTAVRPPRRAAYHEDDETEVVGRQDDKNNILKLLSPEEAPRRTVITIVGDGGLGKTTLARMIYTSVRPQFEYHAMLSISQDFRRIDIMREMLRQLKDYVLENRDVGDLICELKSFLSTRRYLIILDDVWTVDVWNQLKDALPDMQNGSRVLITSRFINVATSADSKMPPYELNRLDSENSLDLLLKNALPYTKSHKECPSDLLEVANELSKKCIGIPLCLTVLGHILSKEEQNYHAWDSVLQQTNFHSTNTSDVLGRSYQSLPYNLKACFLYLTFFPEDYEISAKRLIRMWVAEGLIPCEESTTMENIAQKYLEEIVTRSMVQVSSRSPNGSIKRIYVHDLLRDLAMQEADNQHNRRIRRRAYGFSMVFSKASNVNQPNRRIRRAYFEVKERNPHIVDYIGPNIRSLQLFWLQSYYMSLECYNFRLLKVLELVGVKDNLDMVQICGLKSLDELIHLKYMGFRNWAIGIFPCTFNRMKTLETLDVRGTGAKLPSAIWTIGTLRHVLCDHYDVRGALEGPKSTADLSNLQTMHWIQPLKLWDRELPIVNNLHKLGVCEVEDWVTMTNLLETLPSLISLGIKARWYESLPVEIIYPKALPNYHNLQSLYLKGEWSKTVTLEAILFPPNLIKLTLYDSQLEQNPMPELGKLNSLKKLCIGEYVLKYSGPITCPAGFPVLQYLQVDDSRIEDVIVAEGVMPNLTYLQASYGSKIHLPPKLQHLTVNTMQ